MGLNRMFSFLGRNKEFPEQGVYKKVQYRIDGDSMIVRCSNGREIELRPHLPSGVFDELRAGVIDKKIQFDDAMLTHWAEPPNPNEERISEGVNKGFPVKRSAEEMARAYRIPVREYIHLIDTGNEIMIKYWRARAK